MDSMIQTFAGSATDELLAASKDVVGKIFGCKDSGERLENTLEGMIPILQEVLNSGIEFSQHRQKQLTDLYEKLQKGKELVQTCSNVGRFNVFERYGYGDTIEELERVISYFNETQGLLHVMSDMQHLRVQVGNIERKIEATREESRLEYNMGLSGIGKKPFELPVPELPNPPVGLKPSVSYLKNRLLSKDVRLFGVTGMVGIGKTTLAIALCWDAQVKDHFKERIFFVRVSKSPNLKGLLERMWDKIVGGHRPDFHDDEDAHTQLQQRFRQSQPTLVVLDDVWEIDHLEKLSFEGEGYKTLITTRDNNVIKLLKPDCRYVKEILKEPDDVSLFCSWAFDQRSIPDTITHDDLVKEVIKKCGGLPLALKLIGRSLREKDHISWLAMKSKLSQGQRMSNDHEKMLSKCMATCIDILEKNHRECFLDMAIFPGGRRISVEPLLDLGLYVHKLEWGRAYEFLEELASQNLVNLVNNKQDILGDAYGSSDGLSFIQHDALRDLAIYMTEQEPTINRRKRLIMPQKADAFPKNWKKAAKSCAIDAEIVSLHTGLMKEEDWCQMEFPKAKALILNFSASEYFLPPFLKSMPKLKVLIIVNRNSKRATLKGTSVFSLLTKLKVVRLERVIVPPLQEYCQSWQKLEKLSFILCEGFGNMGFYFPHLLQFTIDHCSNLEELSASICNMTSLQRLSVTNCHDLRKLSDDIRNLNSLQMLRLYACTSLEVLPYSICELSQLELLDISLCGCMKELPHEVGRLSSLKEIDMRECSRVKKLPESASHLRFLQHVICDEKIEHQWLKIKTSTHPRLRVEVAKEDFNLGWLED